MVNIIVVIVVIVISLVCLDEYESIGIKTLLLILAIIGNSDKKKIALYFKLYFNFYLNIGVAAYSFFKSKEETYEPIYIF